MAEQQYIYVAAPAVVAAPASYAGYTGYSQTSETAYVQPGYTTMVQVPEQSAVGASSYAVPGYQYDAQTQQFSQTAQGAVIQNAAQSEYATQAAYAQPAGATAYAQQLATQQAALSYGPQTVVYGGQSHLAAAQLAVGQTGAQQANTLTPTGATNAYQQMVPQQLSMPVGYPNQQLSQGQVQQIQYTVQQTGTAGSAYAGQPQALASLQASGYTGSTLLAQQGGVAYAQQGTANAQQSPFGSQTFSAGQAQQPPSIAFTLQQQAAVQQQQQAAAAVVAAAYGQTPQQSALYGAAQQNLQSAFANLGSNQGSLVSLTAQQQNQQNQLFIGSHGSMLSTPGLAAPAAFMASANAASGRTLSLPGQNGSLGSSFLQLGSQAQRNSGISHRGFGDREHNHDNHGNSSLNQSSSDMEVQRFPDTIFIQGLPDDTTEEMLIQHFGAVGKLKIDTRTGKPRVTLVKDKVTGRPRGEATMGYQDIESVSTAIKMFNNKEFQGRKIRVEVASRKVPSGQQSQASSAVKRSHPGDDSLDWTCPNPTCNNQNFSWRTECNRCKGPRPEQNSLLKAAAALRRADNGALRGGLNSIAANSRGALGLGLGLRTPASLQAASVASLAAATLRARLSGLSALGSLGMGLGGIPTMPGGPMRAGLRGRIDRRGGRPY